MTISGHPITDPRRAAALRAYLRRLATSVTPGWSPTSGRDDFASALLEIAARLAEETTRRLDGTAERDAIAFFDFLGLPPVPPRAATGVLVLTLTDGFPRAVVAPARTQVVAADVTFETQQGLRVVPGRITDLIATDPGADRIERAPAAITSVEPPAVQPDSYTVLTFAGTGSLTVQVSPAAGLAAGDLIRIGATAHRVAGADANGLVTLLDGLAIPLAAGTTVTRITALESFDLRDLQRHAFYVGHQELLNLDQPARLAIELAPAGLARELTGLGIVCSTFGTVEGEDEPAWQPLVLRGTAAGAVRLAKTWSGSVDQVEVGGHKSRWIRVELRGPVTGRRAASAASSVRLQVESEQLTPTEGSRTVVSAAHNGAPLSTARRFLPFGPEPLRFDVFALAAPEALSKKGADVAVDMILADASVTSFEIAVTGTAADPVRGYGAGVNGNLEVLTLTPRQPARWQELKVEAADGRRLTVTGAAAAQVTLAGGTDDLAVVRDRDGALWTARITYPSAAAPPSVVSGWLQIPALPGATTVKPPDGLPAGPVLVPAPAGSFGVPAVLLDVADGVLNMLLLFDNGQADRSGWRALSAASAPELTGAWQLTPVQGSGWPVRSATFEVVATADDGGLWLGQFDARSAWIWERLGRIAASDRRPAATRFGAGDLWIAYAAPEIRGLIRRGNLVEDIVPADTLDVAAGTTLHADPGAPGIGGLPAMTVAAGDAANPALLWLGRDLVTRAAVPADAAVGRPILLGSGLILGGAGERIFRATVDLPATMTYDLHDVVVVNDRQVAHLVEMSDPAGVAATAIAELGDSRRRIKQGDLRVYEVAAPALVAGRGLRFLRYPDRIGLTFTGTAGAVWDTLVLDTADRTLTKVGMRLVIGDESYEVTALADGPRTATLDRGIPSGGAQVDYQPTTVLGTDVVTAANLRTLLELDSGVLDRDVELDLGFGARPRPQHLRLQERSGRSLWGLLRDPWTTPPPDHGDALASDAAAGLTWTETVLARGYQNPDLSWEYFDGQGWRRLAQNFLDGTRNLSASGQITFTVPADLAVTEIGGKEDYWIRARLIGGDYGRPDYVVTQTPTPSGTRQTITVDTSGLRPPEILAVEARFVLPQGFSPELMLVENNLDVRDETQAAAATSARFALFEGVVTVDDGRSIHVGLSAAPGRGSITLLVDAADQPGTTTLRADVRTPAGWRRVAADDRTRSLRRRGLVTLTLDTDAAPVRLFGQERVWLRLRPDAPAPDESWAPVVRGMRVNAVELSQARTVENEIVASSLGEPNLTAALAEHPVLPDSVRLRVREDLTEEDRTALDVLDDRQRFPGSWVLWQRVDSLVGQRPDARVFVLEPASGRLRFGDGRTGKIPPAGRDGIRCFSYQQGGDDAGNLPAWTPARLTSAVEGVDSVILPIDTAGGYDVPAAATLFATAPARLRHAGQAMSPADIEALAVTASGDVVRAHCARPAGPRRPIRVAIVVRGPSRRPMPTLAQRDTVAAFLRQHGWGGLAEDAVEVGPPDWLPVAVSADLVAPRDRLAEVEAAATAALVQLFDPVSGGPDGTGWPFGRRPVVTDLLRTLGGIPGLDRVVVTGVTAIGARPLDRLPADGLVCADATDITVTVTAKAAGG